VRQGSQVIPSGGRDFFLIGKVKQSAALGKANLLGEAVFCVPGEFFVTKGRGFEAGLPIRLMIRCRSFLVDFLRNMLL